MTFEERRAKADATIKSKTAAEKAVQSADFAKVKNSQSATPQTTSLVTTPKTASTPLMNALSTGKTDNVKTNTNTSYKPIAVPTSAQKMANVGINFKPTTQSQINTVNGISNKTITPTPMVQDKQTDTDVERGFYALGNVLSGNKANTPLTGLRYDLARGAAGLTSLVEGATDFVVGGLNNVGSTVASLGGTKPNAVSQFFDRGAQYVYDNDVAGAMRKGIEDKVGDNKNWSSNITGELWDMAGNIIAASGTGKAASELAKVSAPVLSKAVFGVSQGGNSAQQAYNEGATTMQAAGYGNVIAAATIATESMFGGVPTFGKGVLDDLIKGLGKSPKAVQALVDMVGEGGEEAVQTYITPYLQRIYYNPEAKNATIDEMLTSFAYGAGLSGIMQAPSVIGSIGAKPNAPSDNVQPTAQNVPNNMQNSGQSLTPNLPKPNANKSNVNEPNNVSVNPLAPNLQTATKSQPTTFEEYKQQNIVMLMIGKTTEAKLFQEWKAIEAQQSKSGAIENEPLPKVYTPEELSKIDTSTKEGRLLLGRESDRYNISKQDTGTRKATQSAANKAWGKVSKLSVGDVLVDLPTALNGDFKSEHNWNVTAVDGDGVQLVNYRTGKAIWIFKDGVKSGDALGFVNDINDNTMLTQSEAKSEYDAFMSEKPSEATQAPVIGSTTNPTTDTAKAVEVDTGEQGKAEAQARAKPSEKIDIEERDYENVKSNKVNAFQFDNPELHEHFAQAAQGLLSDIKMATKGERWALKDEDGYFIGSDGVKRSVSKPLERLLDNANLKYAQVEKALNAIISDHGQENYPAAKKVELVLDEMLSDGYEVEGYKIPADEDYIAKKEAIANGNDTSNEYRMSEDEWNALMATEPQETVNTPKTSLFPSNSLGAKITKGMPQGTGAVEAGFDKLGALVNKYGAIPEGENPHSAERVTEERIPKQTADDDKVSQTVRTAYEAPLTTNETAEHIEEAVLEKLFSYKKSTDRAALEEADKTIADKGAENALSDWREDIRAGKVTKKLSALGWKLYNEAAKAGDGKRAVEILVDITNMTRNAAQTTQAASLLKKMSPEYQLYAVQRSVQRMNDQIAEVNEKRTNKISSEERRKAKTAAEDMSKAVKEESTNAVNDVVGELAKVTKKRTTKSENKQPKAEKTDEEKAAEKLANKVDSTTKPRKAPEVDAINDMVNELFKSAKESPLPERAAVAKRSPIEFLTQAIKNKAEYTDVWGKAKDILLEKYADNQPVLDMLNDYFEKGIVPTYSDATLTSSVKQVLKDLGIKLSQMKELTWENRQRVMKSLTNYLVEKTGAADGDAKALSRDVADKLTKLIIDSAPTLNKKQRLEIKQATQDALRKHGVPVESWADETGRLIAEGISKNMAPAEAPAPKAITNIITDDIKKFVGTIPKPLNTLVTRNAIDRYTDFMENRQYYTEAWNKLQSELKAKYANNPEALKAIDHIVNKDAQTAATEYYTKQLDSMINKALKSINVKLSELVMQGKASKQATIEVVTNILINESGIDSETAKSVSENIAERFNEMLKEKASKRISSMFPSKRTDVSDKRSLDNKLESLVNLGTFESEDFNSIATERLLGIKDVTINPKLADAYVQAKTAEERKAVLEDIYHDVAAQIPATFADKFDAWRYTAMLFNPVTHIKNIGGNYAFRGQRSIANTLSASVQLGASRLGANFEMTRARLTKKDSTLIEAADEDYTKFADEIYKVGKFDDVKSKINDYRTIFGRGGKTKVGNAISKTVGVTVEKGRNLNTATLDAEDMWVSRPAYVKALAGYLKANGVDFKTASPELLNRARAFAILDAQKAAYRDSNAFSDFIATAGRGKPHNKVARGLAKGPQIISEGILPFRRTLANMFVRSAEFSPLGFVKTITYDSYRLAHDDITASEYIDNLSEGLTGTALFALGAFLRAQGILELGGSGDDKEDKLHETEGKQHFSINIAGKSYTIDWLAPLIVPIFMGAALYDLKVDTKDDGVKLDDVLKIATDITDPMLEMSMMSSLTEYIDGFSRAKQQDQNLIWYGISQGALSYLGQAVPTIGGRIARTIDPTRRTSFTDPTSGIPQDLQYFMQTQLGKIPFAASTKQPYVDQWGRTQESGSLLGRLGQNFVSPGYMKDINISPMETEIERLYNDYAKEHEINVLPPVSVSKYFANNGEDVYMTADEYTQYKKTSGQTAYKDLTKLTSSAEYKSMTDAEKAKAVSEVYSQSAEKAKTEIMEARGEMRIPTADIGEKIQSYVDAGLDEKKAYSLYNTIESLDAKTDTNAGKYTVIQSIAKQGLTPKQQAALVGTLYTSHDNDGNVTDESLLPYINNSARLLSLYTTSKGENTSMINMTIPKSFDKSKVTYELTDEEKKLYKDTYVKEFNAHITNLSTELNVEYWSKQAADKAKLAVINNR